MEMVLNDLSIKFPLEDRFVAKQLMSDFVVVLSHADRLRIKPLRTAVDLYGLLLADQYPMQRWLNDPEVDREERRFLLKTLLKTRILDESIQDEEKLSDFQYQGERCYALGIAYLLDALAISFRSDQKWNSSTLQIEITRIDDRENSEELLVEEKTVLHASREEHISEIINEIKKRLEQIPWSPQDETLASYQRLNGTSPLGTWLNSLDDSQARSIILSRLNRIRSSSNFGDCKSVGEGVFEFKIDYGPGYRIYFGLIQNSPFLLSGGNKSTQAEDIKIAKKYWKDYRNRID